MPRNSHNPYQLLEKLCAIHAPSGEEYALTAFILDYIKKESKSWKVKPEIYHGEGFQDNIVLKFGKPRTAIFAHLDSIGFTVRYENQLIPIGGPEAEDGYRLVGKDGMGEIVCRIKVDEEGHIYHDFARPIQRGTSLTFQPDFRETAEYVQSPYMDNRLGVLNALEVAKDLEDGVIVFSTWEEHGGGSVPYLAKFTHEKWGITQALISDITWVTEGVQHGLGVAISMRDRNIPRRSYVNRIIEIAEEAQIPYQLEVEGAGSSDGRELQVSPYPFDWCFVGAPEDHVHSPNEIVHKADFDSMVALYRVLMKHL